MYLMDTCAFLWFLEDDIMLSVKAKTIISESRNLYLSVASLWEIAIKKSIGKLSISKLIIELEEISNNLKINILPIKTQYLQRIQMLPWIHNDPFDRLIMATALEENLFLITHDAKIRRYHVSVYW